MITDHLYALFAGWLRASADAKTLFMAIGGGDPAWDRQPPLIRRDVTGLANELARKKVVIQDIHFLDAADKATEVPSSRLRLRVHFGEGEATGTLREFGLFAEATEVRNSGTLVSYIVHAHFEKPATMSLGRSLLIDLTPLVLGGIQPTRFLGNSHSREVHDMENLSVACQVGEILFDRRIYFGTAEQAVELGYDRCAFCFGRTRSQL